MSTTRRSPRAFAGLRAATALTVTVVLVAGLAACGKDSAGSGQGSAPGATTSVPPIGDGPLTAEQRYGQAPVKDPAVKYQPDVVFVGNGPSAVKDVDASGTSWTLDGKADGVKDLEPGKILFASRSAIGRVAKVENVGDDRKVLLAPVQLTEVIQDGHLKIDQPVDLGAATAQQIPDMPYSVSTLSRTLPDPDEKDKKGRAPTGPIPAVPGAASAGSVAAAPVPVGQVVAAQPLTRKAPAANSAAVRTVALPALRMGATASQPSPFNLDNASANLQMGSWSMQPFGSKDGLGIRAMYNASSDMGGIKGGFTLNLEYAKPRIKMDMPISGGKAGPSSYSIEGLRKLSLKVEIGSGQGVKDNQRVRLEVPVDIAQTQMYAYGLPIASTVKFKMIIELGFSSKNTTAKIRAEYGLDGPLGVANNAPLKPTVSKVLDPRDATENLSLAPFGLMVAWEVKWMVGVGTPQFMGGIYTKLAISFGAYSEGAMGFAHCESGIIQMTLSGGVGYGLSNQAKTYWNKLFGNLAAGPKAVKLEGENQVTSGKLFETGWAKPNSKYCRAE